MSPNDVAYMFQTSAKWILQTNENVTPVSPVTKQRMEQLVSRIGMHADPMIVAKV